MEPDLDAFLTANKALIVIFIIIISLANLWLIVKQIRKPLFYQNVKAMIIFSLAIGNLLFALFPLVVNAKYIYESKVSLKSCILVKITATYMNYLIHFVYGMGLVTLGAEILLRHRIYDLNIHRTIVAFFASSIPWILGLVIILPLCLAKVDWETTCANNRSVELMLGVSVFFPASLAAVVTAILHFMKFFPQDCNPSINSNQPQVVSQPHHQQPSGQQYIDQQPSNEQLSNQIHMNGEELNQSNQHGVYSYSCSQPALYQYPNNNQYPDSQPGVNQYPSNQPGVNQYPSDQRGVNQYPSNQPGVYQYPSNQPGAFEYLFNPPGVYPYQINQYQTINILVGNNPPSNPAHVSFSNRKTEVQRLLIIVIVFFILVVPVAGLTLNMNKLVWPDRMAAIVVTQILFWVMVLRPFLTPLIMIGYSDL